LLHRASEEPDQTPAMQEIPVEIVPEPPPPPPPPKADPVKPDPQAEMNSPKLEPGLDAPSGSKQEKTERDASDDESKSTRQAPDPAKPPPSASPAQAVERPRAAPPPLPPPESIAELPAPEAQADPAEQPATPPAKSIPDKSKRPTSIEQQLAAAESLPDDLLDRMAKSTPVTGGSAATTYLSILYGLIMPRLHIPPAIRGQHAKSFGQIGFIIDGGGQIMQMYVIRTSGIRVFDDAALAAVRQSSPVPAPPGHRPLSVVFTFDSK
jgi:protein TonB